MNFIQMSYADWAKEFGVIQNPFRENYVEHEFETFGEEFERVRAVGLENPRRVWTHIDTPEGEVIVNGNCRMNRLGYFITEKAGLENTEYEVE